MLGGIALSNRVARGGLLREWHCAFPEAALGVQWQGGQLGGDRRTGVRAGACRPPTGSVSRGFQQRQGLL